jgi:hypothetical protein
MMTDKGFTGIFLFWIVVAAAWLAFLGLPFFEGSGLPFPRLYRVSVRGGRRQSRGCRRRRLSSRVFGCAGYDTSRDEDCRCGRAVLSVSAARLFQGVMKREA